jgi:hypothetical protein
MDADGNSGPKKKTEPPVITHDEPLDHEDAA